MPRHTQTEVDLLLQEVRSLELLAEETVVPPEKVQEYWSASAELITLVSDIEAAAVADISLAPGPSELLALRRRLREVAASLAQMLLD